MGPIFYKNILKHGSIFSIFQNFWVFTWQTPENFEKWVCILRKIPKNGYLFWPKWPLNMGIGFEAPALVAHPQTKSWVHPWAKKHPWLKSSRGQRAIVLHGASILWYNFFGLHCNMFIWSQMWCDQAKSVGSRKYWF